MSDAENIQRMIDEHEIRKVRRKWAYGRDLGEWESLKTCFHPDATVSISWYSGSAEGFIEQSKKMVAGRRPEEHSKHWFGNFRVEVRGARGVLESDAMISARDYLDGHLFDYVSYGRFYDLFEKRAGAWRIAKWTCIYDKDALTPVIPGSVPPSFFDQVKLEGPESGFAFMRFRQGKKGRPVPPYIVHGGSDDERKLRAKGERWLAGG
jgi:hypothetical protein